jgi:ArsR family transcriptional regulator, arsenate/arsenite/antimonite-responsive transcriptional repressor
VSDDRLDELERRIARLESRGDGASTPRRAEPDAAPLQRVISGWGHEAKKRSLPGTVGYAGAAYVAGRENLWARQHSLAELLSTDWSPAAGVLESLGSTPRLALLGALLRDGRRTSAELQEALGGDQEETTTGQLYHHLRELQAARLITQRRRGEYEIAPQAVVPVLAIVAAALNLATDFPVGPLAGIPESE